MTTTPTLEQFLSQPYDPEDDHDFEPAAHTALAGDPLASIADSLARLVGMVEKHETEESDADRLRELLDDLDAKHAVLYDLVLEVESIIKPSTSKLANNVREAIDRWRGVEPSPAAEVEPVVEPPYADGPPPNEAPIDEWVTYARDVLGPDVDLSRANRSAIRTMLGLPHPAASPEAAAVVEP